MFQSGKSDCPFPTFPKRFPNCSKAMSGWLATAKMPGGFVLVMAAWPSYSYSCIHYQISLAMTSYEGYPWIIHFTWILHYKPSIWGYPHLWKPPYNFRKTSETRSQISWFPSVATSARPATWMSATTAKGKGRTFTSRAARWNYRLKGAVESEVSKRLGSPKNGGIQWYILCRDIFYTVKY